MPRWTGRYAETFQRHRVLFGLPILVAMVFAAWFALGAAPNYISTTALWIDNGPAAGSSLYTMPALASAAAAGDYAQAGPALAERQVLGELQAEPKFDFAVGDGSLLPHFLASGTRTGFSPTVLLKRNHGSPTYDAAVAAATEIKAAALGPQVLRLSYTGPSPAVARSMLASLTTQLEQAAPAYADQFTAQEADLVQQARTNAARTLVNAQGSAAAYKRLYPWANAQSDTDYAALVASEKSAKAALASATSAISLIPHGTGPGMKAIIRVIDPPSLASQPTVTHTALGVLGGLVAGLMVSLLAIFVATPTRQLRWDDEISSAPWTRVTPYFGKPSGRGHAAPRNARRPTRGVA